MSEGKIDVTATLRHAPSTRAEFLVSAIENSEAVRALLLARCRTITFFTQRRLATNKNTLEITKSDLCLGKRVTYY